MGEPTTEVKGLYRKEPIETESYRDAEGSMVYASATSTCPFDDCGDVISFEFDHYGVGPHQTTDCPHIVDNDSDYATYLDGMTPELRGVHRALCTGGHAILMNLPAVYAVGCDPIRGGTYMIRRAYAGEIVKVFGRGGPRFRNKADAAWYCVEDAIRLTRGVV